MVLEWLSRLLSGFSSNLGGFVNRSVWGQGSGNLSENQFQNESLYKFSPSYTYQANIENVSSFLDNLSNFSYAEQAVKRVNLQRQVNLDWIDKEVETLRGITIPTPTFTSYERFGKRAKANEVYDRPFSYGSGGGVRRWWIVNPEKKARYESEVAEFTAYKTGALEQISTNINNLLGRRDLITSKAPFSL